MVVMVFFCIILLHNMIKFFHNIRYYVMSNSNSMLPKFPSLSIPTTITDKVQTLEWSLSESVTSLVDL